MNGKFNYLLKSRCGLIVNYIQNWLDVQCFPRFWECNILHHSPDSLREVYLPAKTNNQVRELTESSIKVYTNDYFHFLNFKELFNRWYWAENIVCCFYWTLQSINKLKRNKILLSSLSTKNISNARKCNFTLKLEV